MNTTNNKNIIIKCDNLIKSFIDGAKETTVLKGVHLEIEKGEFVAIMGRSGAGKSTCMYQLSLLDEPTKGEIFIDGKDTHNMTEKMRTDFRLFKLGYVFQDYSLIPELSAVENVALPQMQQGIDFNIAKENARQALESVGLLEKINNLPSEMSGGEQQRTAVARAIAHKPIILFADEPTANLDIENSNRVIEIFKKLNKEGLTVVMVTHEDDYGDLADRIIRLSDGKVVKD